VGSDNEISRWSCDAAERLASI